MAPRLVRNLAILQRIVHHLFLPSHIPQQEDNHDIDAAIVDATHRALLLFRNLLPPSRQQPIQHAVDLLANIIACHDDVDGVVVEAGLVAVLLALQPGKSIALRIRLQNAGVFITHRKNDVWFEAFELAAQNEHVLDTRGRLVRQFPGSAVSIPIECFSNPSFQAAIAQALAQMSSQAAAGTQPQIRKGKGWQDEDRDTTHPRLVTQLLLGGFLKSLGRAVGLNTIAKNTRDEVQWSDAEKPWRRSTMWVLVRVTLQLCLSRAADNTCYKEFMAFFLAQLLEDAGQLSAPCDTQYVMNSKVSRRLQKLQRQGALSDYYLGTVRPRIRDILGLSRTLLEQAWQAIQNTERNASNRKDDMLRLRHLNFVDDSFIDLPLLDRHIETAFQRADPPETYIPPLQSDVINFLTREFPTWHMRDPDTYAAANICALEQWIVVHLRSLADTNTRDCVCREVHRLIKEFHDFAYGHYSSSPGKDDKVGRPRNPEGMSMMILCIVELWVAMDRRAVSECELLGLYDPEIPTGVLQNLLLPDRQQMQRLHDVEKYLTDRVANVTERHGIFEPPRSSECFATRYFNEYGAQEGLDRLKRRIENAGKEKERLKKAELERLKSYYQDLKARAAAASCTYVEVEQPHPVPGQPGKVIQRHVEEECEKCKHDRKANRLAIKVHERPLPAWEAEAKAIVFELRVPCWYAHWRDTTVYLREQVMKASPNIVNPPSKTFPLQDDPHLGDLCQPISRQTVVLWTRKKVNERIHRAWIPITRADDTNLTVNNGSCYEYLRLNESGNVEKSGAFIEQLAETEDVAAECTYALQNRSEALQQFLLRPHKRPNGPSPNTAIANQYLTPTTMTVDEFKDLCTLPLGQSIVWFGILLQLTAPSIDFKKEETVLVFLQCIYQAGRPGHGIARTSHQILEETKFAHCLIQNLQTALDRVRENWESMNALVIFIAVACRLLSLTNDHNVQALCLAFLSDAREVASTWLSIMEDRAQKSADDRAEYKRSLFKCVEIALVCGCTFDVNAGHLETILASRETASTLLRIALLLGERNKGHTKLVPILDHRFKRVLYLAFPIISKTSAGLDNAIKRHAWSAHQPDSSHWTSTNGASDPWLQTTAANTTVHFNLLSGQLLVNGMRLIGLPKKYEAHPLFQKLFGSDGHVEVMSSSSNGLRYSTKSSYQGHSVEFGMVRDQLLVYASIGSSVYEVLSPALLQNSLPEHFVQDYVHWFEQKTGNVHFRPADDPWNAASDRIWTLTQASDGDGWHLEKDGECLLGLENDTSRAVSNILSSLADPTRIHVTLTSSPKVLSVEIPAVQLSFTLDEGAAQLMSTEYRQLDMMVDPDQSLPTLVGLTTRLVLRNEDSKKGHRLVLLPEGPALFAKHGHHIQVRVPRTAIVKVHAFSIDYQFGSLTNNNNSLQGQLLLSYFHALTSFSLPDELTKRTGTEQSLRILRSAAVRSFTQLSQSNVDLLTEISKITPGRCYYPPNEKVMQTVTWNTELSTLSQQGDFFKVVKSVFLQAKRSRMLYPDIVLQLPRMDHVDEELLLRDQLLHPIPWAVAPDAGHELHQADREYQSRDQDDTSAQTERSYIISRMIHSAAENRHWKALPQGRLWEMLKDQDKLTVMHDALRNGMLRYDAGLLQDTSPPITTCLLPLHYAMSTHDGRGVDRYALMIWLCSMAYSEHAEMELLQTVALTFTAPQLRRIPAPTGNTMRPSLGLRPTKGALSAALIDARKSFEVTPDYTSPRREKELAHHVSQRRQDDYERHSKTAVQSFAEFLRKQWPSAKLQMPQATLLKVLGPYIDIDRAMVLAGDVWQSFRNVLSLKQYCDELESSMARLDKQALLCPIFRLHPTPAPASAPAFISLDDVFSGPPPSLEDLCELERLQFPAAADEHKIDVQSMGELESLFERLEGNCEASYEKEYLEDLRKSYSALQDYAQAQINIPNLKVKDGIIEQHVLAFKDSAEKLLQECQKHVEHVFESIRAAITQRLVELHGCKGSFDWPQICPTLLLEQLNRLRWKRLTPAWKRVIVRYGTANTSVQWAERVLSACEAYSRDALAVELENRPHSNWDPYHFPESLLLEVESGITIRRAQEQIASIMRDPPDGRNAVMQLNMGGGKSSVITPIVAAALANLEQLVRVIVAKPQSKQMAEMLISKLGGLLNRRVYYMPFSRSLKLDEDSAKAFEQLCQECMRDGGILLVQPEHILSFKLSGPESFVSGNEAAGKVFLRLQNFFDTYSRDIIDESDENFNVRFELIYTMGLRRPVEYSPDRWTFIQAILAKIDGLAASLATELPSAVEYHKQHQGSFARLRLLDEQAAKMLFRRLAQDICHYGLRGLPGIERQNRAIRDALFRYVTEIDITVEEQSAVEDTEFWTQQTKNPIRLLRGLIATGILEFVFCSKRWRVNYGLTDRNPATRLAVPYRAKDCPSLRSEFSHPEVVILLTSLSYYYGGLSNDDLFAAFGHLMTSDQKEREYQVWIQDVELDSTTFRDLSHVNLNDELQCVSKLFPKLWYSKGAIDYFLSHVVFPREMKEYPHKLSASGCDLGQTKSRPTTGFSGTNDSRKLLPLDVQQLDVDEQLHTNALVPKHILSLDNSVALMALSNDMTKTDGERLIQRVVELDVPVQVILDVGALIVELNNLDVAKAWLSKCSRRYQAAVYCNDEDQICVVDREGRWELLSTSSYASRLKVCIVYLDEAHTRGIDLKLPEDYRAAVTLGPRLTNDRLKQACMRMRKLGQGQTVTLLVPPEIQTKIREVTQKAPDDSIELVDALQWVISQTHGELRYGMAPWAAQNYNHSKKRDLWSQPVVKNQHTLSKAQAWEFCDKEAQPIKYRYEPKPGKLSPLQKLAQEKGDPRSEAILKRCDEFGMLNFRSRKLTEEQERELSPEIDIDAERELQKPPPALPATHSLHRDLVDFAFAGVAKRESKAYRPAFEYLGGTSAAQQFTVSGLGNHSFLATADFARTVVDLGKGSLSDAYQRSVQWVLTGRKFGSSHITCAIIVSPFEAQKLLSHVKNSVVTALHIYRPRYVQKFPPLDKLDLHVITAAGAKVEMPIEIAVQLNVFAGQLYFNSYEEYTETCKFLGLCSQSLTSAMEAKGWKVAADGFILSDDQKRIGGGSGLTKSPIDFLKILLSKVRRHGEDISKTDMGILLGGKIFKPSEFKALEW